MSFGESVIAPFLCVASVHFLTQRENMINSLQTRIDVLESTLARLLKERGKEVDPNSKSMVDLSLWMSSSPRSAQKQVGLLPLAFWPCVR